jgi:hypothetical protein
MFTKGGLSKPVIGLSVSIQIELRPMYRLRYVKIVVSTLHLRSGGVRFESIAEDWL